MQSISVFSGSSHPGLATSIASYLNVPLSRVECSKFSNLETSVQILDSVRDNTVFLIQSGCGRVNDSLMELLVMISACKFGSAAKVVVVLPYFPYSRQGDGPTGD